MDLAEGDKAEDGSAEDGHAHGDDVTLVVKRRFVASKTQHSAQHRRPTQKHQQPVNPPTHR